MTNNETVPARRVIVVAVLLGLVGWGCASTSQTGGGTGGRGPRADLGDPAYVDLRLAPPGDSIATVQLYRYPNETSLPVIAAGTDQVFNLEFDILNGDARPLRVEFKHFDRRWDEDYLHPTEYMAGQFQDDILNYRRSLASRSNYVHYSYTFPNTSIQFKRSGNYLVTVMDPSSDNDVLIELPFLISEEAAEMEYQLRAVPIPGRIGLLSQPIVYIDPGSDPSRDLFDYGACFVKNTRFDLSRCSVRPSLFEAPYASFSLEIEDSFEPEPDLHVVDLSALRRSDTIDEVHFDTSPYEVILVPDQADLGGTEESFQNGQSSVSASVVDVGNPDIEAEYVHATFRYIPYRSERAVGDVIVTGSFNRWVLDAANRLVWNEAEKMYEGTILLKQGVHAYQYHVSGPRPPSQGAFAPESSYTALLYYFDPVMHVDRLIAVRSKIAP